MNTKIWKPHSTRGAGVKFYKTLGMTSKNVCELGTVELVLWYCELGKWKNTSAFTSHYLRLGAAENARLKITQKFVHKTSYVCSEEVDLTRTPEKFPEAGGSVRETDEQNTYEAHSSSPVLVVCGSRLG